MQRNELEVNNSLSCIRRQIFMFPSNIKNSIERNNKKKQLFIIFTHGKRMSETHPYAQTRQMM